MPTICLHCALVALVNGQPPTEGYHDETPEAHLARVHPNGVDPQERADLERRAAAIIQQQLKGDS